MSRPLTVFRPEPRPVRWVYAVVSPVAMVVAVVIGVVKVAVLERRQHRSRRDIIRRLKEIGRLLDGAS